VSDPTPATITPCVDNVLHVLAKHLLDRPDPGRQTEALEGAVHFLLSRLEAGHERWLQGRYTRMAQSKPAS
jgi:hypothetical protein